MNAFVKISTPALLLALTLTARAQDLPIPDYTLANQGRIGTLITQGVIDDYQKTAPPTSRNTGPNNRSGSLAYTPAATLKQQTVLGYIERLRNKNPVAAQAIAASFGPGKYDYGTIYQGLVKGNGLRENDAVDVMCAYMVLGYMIVNNIQDGDAVTPQMVQGVRTQFGPKLAGNPKLNAPGVAAQLGEEMKLQFVAVQGGWQSAIKENTLPAYQQGIASLFKTQWNLDFSQLTLTKQGFVSANRSTRPASVPAASNSPVPGVEGWFFRAVSAYPAAVSFEPIVLFKNGDYVEVGEQPLELLNIPQAKQSQRANWGTWQKKGGKYVLTNAKNQSVDYQLGSGNWFPAYPYASGIALKRGYERVSGGDYGTGTAALAVSKINFLDATHFTEGLNAGIQSANAAGGKKTSAAGTYKLYGNTLELTYGDGKVVRKSFAIGAEGSPPKPTPTLIFIGGYAYTDTN